MSNSIAVRFRSLRRCVRSTMLLACLSAYGHSAAQVAASPQIVRESPVYSVCEVLRNPSTYEGRWIRVRGVLTDGGDHPSRLATGDCQGLDMRPWSPTIALSDPDQPFLRDRVVGLKVDDSRLNEFFRVVETLRAEAIDRRVWATFCGVFQAKGARVFTFPKAKEILYGYGHLGSARAQLIYEYAENASYEQSTSGR